MSSLFTRKELEEARRDYGKLILEFSEIGGDDSMSLNNATLAGILTEIQYLNDNLFSEDESNVIDFPTGFRPKTEKTETD